MRYRYYVINLEGNNSYKIREFEKLNSKTRRQIKRDLEFMKECQSLIVSQDKRMFQTPWGCQYLAKTPKNKGDIEIDNPFVKIRTPKGKEFQYHRDAFQQTILFLSPKETDDSPQEKIHSKPSKESFTLDVDRLDSLDALFSSLLDWIKSIASIAGSKFRFFSSDIKREPTAKYDSSPQPQ